MNNNKRNNITIRKADEGNIWDIHNILSNAFLPYLNKYTKEAYQATVLSPQILKKRIRDKKVTIIGAVYDKRIIGTVSFQMKSDCMYVFSMAVDPLYQKNGVGTILLNEIQERAIENNCRVIKLDTYYSLEDAVLFYESHGFKRTGRTRDYHGIEVFEMRKELD